MKDPIPVGEAFGKWLARQSMNQAQFVAVSGLSPATVCRLFNAVDGDLDKMRWGTIRRIRAALDEVEAP